MNPSLHDINQIPPRRLDEKLLETAALSLPVLSITEDQLKAEVDNKKSVDCFGILKESGLFIDVVVNHTQFANEQLSTPIVAVAAKHLGMGASMSPSETCGYLILIGEQGLKGRFYIDVSDRAAMIEVLVEVCAAAEIAGFDAAELALIRGVRARGCGSTPL